MGHETSTPAQRRLRRRTEAATLCLTLSSLPSSVFAFGIDIRIETPQIVKDIGGAVDRNIVKPVDTGAKKLNEEATKAAKEANSSVTEKLKDANTGATEKLKDVNTGVTEKLKEANTGVTNKLTEANTAITDRATATNKSVTETIATNHAQLVERAAIEAKKLERDVRANLDKAGRDIDSEKNRFGKGLEEAGQAIGHYVENQAKGAEATIRGAERRIREGKVVDAFWHLAVDPAQYSTDNAAKALTESQYLNTVAQVAATAYGGPQGAAAYAAWLTFKQTGDADLALRAGLLAYVTSEAFASAEKMGAATTSEVARKAAVVASIGGLAVAAAGGDEEAVKSGFLKAGAMVLVVRSIKEVTK